MKELLNIGNSVDDGTGDYMRAGGEKINNNFNEIYTELGDGSTPYPAGAWKTINSAQVQVLSALFGKSYTINTSAAKVRVELPKGNPTMYGRTIKIRDVYSTWSSNPVTVVPAIGDTLKGESGSKEFPINLTDLELVYCAPGRWEFISNRQVNRISTGDVSTISRREFIATQGQTDFLDIFNGNDYNSSNIQIYRRGNLLYYGTDFSSNSDFGSPGTGTEIIALDGQNIRLKEPCEAGDAVIVITFMDGVAQWRSTYNRLGLIVLDKTMTNETSIIGAQLVEDLTTLDTITLGQLGYKLTSNSGLVNPSTFEVYLNGVFLNESGTSGPTFECDGSYAENREDCESQNGTWKVNIDDYSTIDNDDGSISGIKFNRPLNHKDSIVVKWFNNTIGTTLEIEDIILETDKKYVQRGQPLNLTGTVRITDYNNPHWPNVEENGPTIVDTSNISAIFDIMHPVGTTYENFVNPNNPATYMFFGSWVLAGTSQVLVGWTDDRTDTLFGLNNNDIDVNGNASATAGGTGGHREITLSNDQIPALKTSERGLISDANGTVIIGGCQFDPDDQGPAYDKYREGTFNINPTHTPAKSVDVLPPYVTVYRWMRIA